jgi:UDP-glucose 4-epimerase
VTGGAGYIGTHTCISLVEAGHDIIVIDNFTNSKPEALRRVQEITGKDFPVYSVDLLDKAAVNGVFSKHDIEAVIHFAGLKAPGESVAHPLRYYHNNLTGTLILCEVMAACGVRKMVFSSSASVYGSQETIPLTEDLPLDPMSPYGRTKAMLEQILRDVCVANPHWSIALLRYFNPVGAHGSGQIGEDPSGIPNNLVPYITQVAVGKLQYLRVFGDDYDTPDGTGIRDYIHVSDLANGHLKALHWVLTTPGIDAFNLGTGIGYSVMDMIHAFEQASGVSIPYSVIERRPGDMGTSYCDPTKAKQVLGWQAERTLLEMCADSWRWQQNNPRGYGA